MSEPDNGVSAKALSKLQTNRFETLKRILSNFKKDAVSRKSPTYFAQRLQKVENMVHAFEGTHEHLVTSDLPDTDSYVATNLYEQFDELHLEVICAITEQRDAMYRTSGPSNPDAQVPPAPPTHRIQLPTLPVPTFTGKYVDWASFYDGFRKLVHTNTDLTAVQKFHYLKQALPADTDVDIHQMPLTESNYDTAFKLIVKRHDNARILFMHQMNTLFSLPTLSKERSEDIKSLLNVANVSINAFKQLKIPIEGCDHWIAHLLTAKLPKDTHQAWEMSLGSQVTIPNFADLESFLHSRLATLDAIENRHITHLVAPRSSMEAKSTTSAMPSKHGKWVNKTFHAKPTPQSPKCALCDSAHIIRRCPRFLSSDGFARKGVVEKHHLCFNCLSPTHGVSQCPSTKTCLQCGERHHTLLHFPKESQVQARAHTADATPSGSVSKPPTSALSHSSVVQTNRQQRSTTVLLATALVTVVNPDTKQSTILRALIDQGSECTIISEHAAQWLHLKRRPTTTQIQGIGNGSNHCKCAVSFTLHSRTNNTFQLFIETAYVLPKLTTLVPSNSIPAQTWLHLQNLDLADPSFHVPSKIDLILGAGVFSEILLPETKIGARSEPIGQNTLLEWILSGKTQSSDQRVFTLQCHHATTRLETLVKSFFDSEQIPEEMPSSQEDQWCEQFFRSTHVRQSNGKYLVRLPLKSLFDPTQTLGKSRQIALNRFHQLERRLNRKPAFKENYSAVIADYFMLQQIRPALSTAEQCYRVACNSKPTATTCVLPHHAVIKEESTSTKLRVVFDASSKTSNGTSLNDILCPGPPLQNDLSAIILNWRLHRYVFTADIQKMYRCIDMHSDDANYQRILWRNPTGDLQEFCLTTVTFGTASAPYTAIRVLHQLASDERHRYPLAEHPLKHEIYVDDVLTGNHSIQEALNIRDQLIGALRSAGMELRKWASNSPRLVQDIPPDHHSGNTLCKFPSDDAIKTLGISWQPKADILKFRFLLPNADHATKRYVLSVIARLFDPLGIIAPVIVAAKIFLKTIWSTKVGLTEDRKGLDWDTPLPESMQTQWRALLHNLPDIDNLKVPRWLQFDPTTIQSVDLHAFCDGSTMAYAASVYLRIQHNSGQTTAHLIVAKTRVTPTKPLTIPRIELCGAALAVDLVQWVKSHLAIFSPNVPIYYWTDATIILHWIRGDSNKLKTFVANRVAKVLEHSAVDQWNYVNTEDNPADCATRGLTPSKLATFDLWWHGPPWLCHPAENWPANPIDNLSPEDQQAETKCHITQTANQIVENSPVQRYSSYTKLLRIIGWVLRFADNTKPKNTSQRRSGPLSVTELNNSLHRLTRVVQCEVLALDILHLKAGKPLPARSKLRNLNPFLDEHDVLRVGGRLKHSALSFQRKHPIILPSAHHFMSLVIHNAHVNTLHGGTQLTLTHLRQRFWILRGRQTVQKQLRKCITCFRNRPRVTQQLMGNLPFHRVNPPQRPFLATGVDFTGAIELKASKYRGHTVYKGYIAIFICLATKAIHLEAVTGLSTECFLQALQRFFGRRGTCHDIYSDCGTNFIGADRVLQQNHKTFLQELERNVIPNLACQQITWHFNPPYTPNFGGLCEANVKAVKHHLKRIVNGTPLTYEVLSTLLARIEACLNSRPLCPLSSDPEDLDALTPAHFLIGDSMLAPPEPPAPKIGLRQQHLNQQQLLQQFWVRWSSDWLAHLRTRRKWHTPTPNLREKELVLIKDDRLPPHQWILGRILVLHPGTDGLVRVVSLRTQHGVIKDRCQKYADYLYHRTLKGIGR